MKKRSDGRKIDDIRELTIKVGVVKKADGSAFVQTGKTQVIAAVYGPHNVYPRFLEDSEKAVLNCRYNMVPFSVKDRKRPGYDRRGTEISKVIKEALEPALFLKDFPKTKIDVFMEVIQADSGTRVAALTAAAVALADAGIPMRDLVASTAVGRVNGQIVVDLTKEEEDVDDAIDMPVAIMPREGKVTLLQLDGDTSLKEFNEMLKAAKKACEKISEVQKKALKDKYEVKK